MDLAKITTAIALSFLVGVMLAHYKFQGAHNALDVAEEEIRRYQDSRVVGWVDQDPITKELYFVEK